MKTSEWGWESADGLEMFAQSWEPEENPKASVCVVHGLGEHSGRYAYVGKALADAGFALAGFDLRGNGKSGGLRGHYPSLKVLMDDILIGYQQLQKKFPDVPQFMYGHSLGGLFVLAFATYHEHTLSGVISTAPAIRTPVLEQKLKMVMVNMLSGFLPTLTIPTGLDPTGVSRDPEVVRAYVEDPLVHDKATLSSGKVGLQAIHWVLSHTMDLPIPLLLMHGTEDKVVHPYGSEELAGLIKGDLTHKLFNGLYHEVHNEPEKDEVIQYMVDWMDAHLGR
jgi:alpha-beta hydrolase superfamily lysophospholipase